MANHDAVGNRTPTFEMTIERGKVREFARATQSSSPAYMEDPGPVIPPTFLTTVTFWQPAEAASLYKDLDIDGRRLLHGEQEYIFPKGVPAAGQQLNVTTEVEEIYEKEGKRGGAMTFVVTRSDFVDADGVVVAQARATAIETGQAPTREA